MTSLAEALPGIEGHWAAGNLLQPAELLSWSDVPIRIACEACGEVFESTPHRLMQRRHPFLCLDCADAAGKRGRRGVRVSLAEAVPGIEGHWAQANAGLPDRVPISAGKKFKIVCAGCGRVFESTPNNLRLRKHPFLCRECARPFTGRKPSAPKRGAGEEESS